MKNQKNNLQKKNTQVPSQTIKHMANRIEQLDKEKDSTLETLANTILKTLKFKDAYTFEHSKRVSTLCLILGEELGLTSSDLQQLHLCAILHDIGKIGTPDCVLNKPSRLNDEEYLIIKKHPLQSFEILNEFEGFKRIAKSAKHHHERFDGRGYPDGLKGEKIPLFSRILLITDTYDTIVSDRIYRKGLSPQLAIDELIQKSGSIFDPKLVRCFIKGLRRNSEQQQAA